MITMHCNKCGKEFDIQNVELSNYDPKYDNEDGSLLPYQQKVCWVCNKKQKSE